MPRVQGEERSCSQRIAFRGGRAKAVIVLGNSRCEGSLGARRCTTRRSRGQLRKKPTSKDRCLHGWQSSQGLIELPWRKVRDSANYLLATPDNPLRTAIDAPFSVEVHRHAVDPGRIVKSLMDTAKEGKIAVAVLKLAQLDLWIAQRRSRVGASPDQDDEDSDDGQDDAPRAPRGPRPSQSARRSTEPKDPQMVENERREEEERQRERTSPFGDRKGLERFLLFSSAELSLELHTTA